MSYYYLSNPYNGTEQEKSERVEICSRVCFHFIRQKIPVISPVIHNHAMNHQQDIATILKEIPFEERFDFIMDFDFNLLKPAKAMLLLKLPGWDKSKGVAYEIDFCKQHAIPIIETNLETYQQLEL